MQYSDTDLKKLGPYRGCYPQLEIVPLIFVWHKYRKSEMTRKKRKRTDDDVHSPEIGDMRKIFLKTGEYYVLPYDNCRIISKSTSKCGKGKRERIGLRLPNGTKKMFRKSHCVLSACCPLISPDETVEHLDGIPKKINSNRIENLVWMSVSNNARRDQLLCPPDRRKRTASSKSRAMRRISMVDPTDVQIFKSCNEAARITPGSNTGAISACAYGKIKTHPRNVYMWEWIPQQLRTPPKGKSREVVYFKNLPKHVQSFARSLVSNKRKNGRSPNPPKAASSLGEILTSLNKWTIGSCQKRSHAKSRRYQNVNVATWIYLFFHGMFDPSTHQINHKDGNSIDSRRYSSDTYLSDGTYSNYAWTMYAGTSKENMEDLSAAKKRQKKKRTR